MVKLPLKTTPLVITQPPDLPRQVLLTLKPWKCTDETMEIVIIRSYLEVRRVERGASVYQNHPEVAFSSGCSAWVARDCPWSVGDCSVLSSQPIKDVVNITLKDISCQAEKNATHFMLKSSLTHCGTSLEGKSYAGNEVRRAWGCCLQPH